MQIKYLILLLALGLGIYSCTTDEEPTSIDIGEAYFPMEEGHWVEYELDSVVYDDFDNSVKTIFLDLRVEVGEEIVDGEGSTVRRFYRFTKPRGATTPYVLGDVWFAKLDGNILESIEENLRFIKLSLPPTINKSWAGNEFVFADGGDNPNNSTDFYKNWNYFYEQVGVTRTVNGNTFADVIKINQSDERNAIQHFVSTEYYAKDVGLIEKSLEAIVEDDGTLPKNEPVIDRPLGRRGFAVYYRVTDYSQ